MQLLLHGQTGQMHTAHLWPYHPASHSREPGKRDGHSFHASDASPSDGLRPPQRQSLNTQIEQTVLRRGEGGHKHVGGFHAVLRKGRGFRGGGGKGVV